MGADHTGDGHHPVPEDVARRPVWVAAAVIFTVTVTGLIWLWPGPEPFRHTDRITVTRTGVEPCPDQFQVCVTAIGELPDGTLARISQPGPAWPGKPRPGDVILADPVPGPDGTTWQFWSYHRGQGLFATVGLFAMAVIAVARWRGIAALAGLAASITVVFGFTLPALTAGRSPLAVAVTTATTAAGFGLVAMHGIGVRTAAAFAATAVAATVAAGSGWLFAAAARITGEGDGYGAAVGTLGLDPRGLLLAGLVVGAVGVLDDITVTQVSAVWELHATDPTVTRAGLWRRAFTVGRDHLGAMVNTLLLAYTAGAFPFLVVYAWENRAPVDVAFTEIVAAEIVRAAAGGVGVAAAVPVATGLAVLAVRPVQSR